MKLINEISPPTFSRHKAITRPTRPNPQKEKVTINDALKDVCEFALPAPSNKEPIPKSTVNITNDVPKIRAVHRSNLRGCVFSTMVDFFLTKVKLIGKEKNDFGQVYVMS